MDVAIEEDEWYELVSTVERREKNTGERLLDVVYLTRMNLKPRFLH